MHFMPDTEDADAAAERFWPEGYKQVVRGDFRQAVAAQLNGGKKLRHVYQQQYSEKFTDLNQFANRIADMIAIGSENGVDNAFDELMEAFLTEDPLPEGRRYIRYFRPQAFSSSIKDKLARVFINEYSQDNVYQHAYDSYYQGKFPGFDEFIAQVAQIVVTGAMNGADDMLEAIYRAFMTPHPLPPARRYPRRLKLWAPA
ncbi:hypothetical protein ACFLVW_01635 [Chloroflexota bacterium]